MNLFSLDLELNQPSGKIIQIGACVFSHKDGKIIDKFMVYVNPKEKIDPSITELTGITQTMVELEGYDVKDAYLLLEKFVRKKRAFMTPIVWGSGSWDDSSCLYKQAGVKEPNFMGHRVIDVKTLYQSLRLRSWKKVKGGLSSAMKELGLNFEGRNHNALDDAINTARLWLYLTEPLKSVGPRPQSPQDL